MRSRSDSRSVFGLRHRACGLRRTSLNAHRTMRNAWRLAKLCSRSDSRSVYCMRIFALSLSAAAKVFYFMVSTFTPKIGIVGSFERDYRRSPTIIARCPIGLRGKRRREAPLRCIDTRLAAQQAKQINQNYAVIKSHAAVTLSRVEMSIAG